MYFFLFWIMGFKSKKVLRIEETLQFDNYANSEITC